MCLILLLFEIYYRNRDFKDALLHVLVILIAAIPVGMQTVMTVTMAVGATELAVKKVVVKRLTAIEELASVSILCSDKTGTITLNELSFDKPYLAKKGNTSENFKGTGESYTDEELLLTAYLASEPGATDAIELATRRGAEEIVPQLKNRKEGTIDIPGYKTIAFIPFNPITKYTEATVQNLETGEIFKCIKGAPHVIIEKCGGHDEAEHAVLSFAQKGLRALGVAKLTGEKAASFEMVGMISLLDPPRPDSAATIKECIRLGVNVSFASLLFFYQKNKK
jgi:H+-transporting ATPase